MSELIENFNNLVWWYKVLIILACVCVLLGIFAWCNKEKVKFWWLGFWTSFPLFGTISRLKESDLENDNGWHSCEKTLCSKYDSFNSNSDDPDYYDKCKSYLSKMGEQGRTTLPFLMWIVVIGLVVAEALGFAYVLAGFTVPGASEQVQRYGAVGIAFVISALLVALTHFSGEEAYYNSVVSKMRNARRHDKDVNGGDTFLAIDESVNLEHDDKDDGVKNWKQVLNRLKGNSYKTWYVSTVTAIFIVIVAVGATYVRAQVLENQLIEEVANVSMNAYESAPAELAEIQSSADKQANDEITDTKRKGGWATFIVLAVLFVFIQILGIIFGYKWSFAGKESKKAYKEIAGFKTRREYENYHNQKRKYIRDKATQKLKDMQARIDYIKHEFASDSYDKILEKSERTFDKYLEIEEQNEFEKSIKSKQTQKEANVINAHINLAEKKEVSEIQKQASELEMSPAKKEENNTKSLKRQIKEKELDIEELKEKGASKKEILQAEIELEELIEAQKKEEQNA